MKTSLRIAAALSAATLALGAVLGMAGCSSTSPKDVVDAELKAATGLTVDKIQEMAKDNPEGALGLSAAQLDGYFGESSSLTETQKTAMKQMLDKILDFEYTVDDESVDGDSATVNVTFKTYDLGPAIKEVIDESQDKLLKDATAAFQAGKDYDQVVAEATDQMFSLMADKVSSLDERTLTTQVPISLAKESGDWVMDDLTTNEKFQSAFLGSLTDALSGQ